MDDPNPNPNPDYTRRKKGVTPLHAAAAAGDLAVMQDMSRRVRVRVRVRVGVRDGVRVRIRDRVGVRVVIQDGTNTQWMATL